MRRLFEPGRHLPLLLALCGLFVVEPVLAEAGRGRFVRFGFIVVLAAAVYGLARRRAVALWGLGLAVPALVAQLLAHHSTSRGALVAATATGLVFLLFVTVAVLVSVLRGGEVDADRIAGAISVYLLLGLGWAMAYGTLAALEPTAFQGVDPAGSFAEAEYGFIYYSFTTLTTLGYGDLTPLTPIARSLAWIEAVTGQLFLAILIARLVGLRVAAGSRHGS